MKKLVLLRHGESLWNEENKFTGWTDIGLAEQGVGEAHRAGKMLRAEGFVFDVAFTSVLKRAIRTLWIVLDELDLIWIPVIRSWRLNERHYGALQGLNKTETAEEFGEEQVHLWRRSYDIRPPALDKMDERFPGNDPRYRSLKANEIPTTESLKDTVERILICWDKEIAPRVKAGERLLIAAHGNSLRGLVKFLDNISDEEIVAINIPTGVPLVYELADNLKPLKKYYLGKPEEVEKAIQSVKNQDKARGNG